MRLLSQWGARPGSGRWVAYGVMTTCGLTVLPPLGGQMVALAQDATQVQSGAQPAARAKAQKPKSGQDAAASSDGAVAPNAKKKDSADAQRSIDSGITLLQAGKAEQAIQTFTVAISGGGLPPPLMARALYQRGLAYRKASKPAMAISDLTSALWLKGGLQDADRTDAVQQRAQAYREAGLPDQTDDDGKPAGASRANRTASVPVVSAGSGRAASAPVATASLAPDSAPSKPAASAGGGFFANLFGGGSSAPSEPAPSRPVIVEAPPNQPVTSAWSSAVSPAARAVAGTGSGTRVASAAPVAATGGSVAAAAAAPVMASPAKAVTGGKFRARIALVRSQAEADAVVARLKTQHAAALAARDTDVTQAQFGGMGAFFQVRVGPYATAAEAQAFCVRLKGSGLDCVPVDQ
jgi:SPOR domain